jgi:hypothetical protein
MLHVAVKRYNGDTKELEETDMMSFADSDGGRHKEARRSRPPIVCGLNGHRLYYIISLFKVTYKATIQVSRHFHALITKTFENCDTCD